MGAKNLTNAQKAAIVIVSLGEELASEILKNLDSAEVKRILVHVKNLKAIAPEVSEEVLDEFLNTLGDRTEKSQDGVAFAKKVLKRVLNSEEIAELEKQWQIGQRFKFLEHIAPQVLAPIIKKEHPQTATIILAQAPGKIAAQVLNLLEPSFAASLLVRLSKTESVPSELVDDIAEALEQELKGATDAKGVSMKGGPAHIAQMLNRMDIKSSEKILQEISERDPALYEQVKSFMFVFEDLRSLDTKNIGILMKHIPQNLWPVALKKASKELLEHILKALSSRTSQAVLEDMQSSGPTRLSDVEAAQQKIAATARDLISSGILVRIDPNEVYV